MDFTISFQAFAKVSQVGDIAWAQSAVALFGSRSFGISEAITFRPKDATADGRVNTVADQSASVET